MIKVRVIHTAPVKVSVKNQKCIPVTTPDYHVIIKEPDVYTGDYNIIPQTEPTTLKTKDKLMTDNVTVFRIPYWEVSNPTGTTVFIGGKTDGN